MDGLSSHGLLVPDGAREEMRNPHIIDGPNDEHAISSKYSLYTLANIGENWDPIARPFSCCYMSDSTPK